MVMLEPNEEQSHCLLTSLTDTDVSDLLDECQTQTQQHVSSGALHWVETALRACTCPALHVGVGWRCQLLALHARCC
jgi:hypothetical protein